MAGHTEVETGMLAGSDTNEPVGPAIGATRSNVAWKISTVLVAILGLAVLGRSAGSWAAAEAGSHAPVEITPEALQSKYDGPATTPAPQPYTTTTPAPSPYTTTTPAPAPYTQPSTTPTTAPACYDKKDELPNYCSGWGDPHYPKRFFNLPKTDNFQIGLYPIAKSESGDFEMQGFQCNAGWSASSYAAIAVKIGGKTTTYFGDDNANFEWRPSSGPPGGRNMIGKPSDKGGLTMKSPNLCQSLWLKKQATGKGILGYYLDFKVRMSAPAPWGLCGSAAATEVLPTQRLFNHAEMTRVCKMCKVEQGCEGFHAETTVQDATTVCVQNNIVWSDAVQKCSDPRVHEDLRKSCVFDYCATGGDASVVDNAAAESEHLSNDDY